MSLSCFVGMYCKYGDTLVQRVDWSVPRPVPRPSTPQGVRVARHDTDQRSCASSSQGAFDCKEGGYVTSKMICVLYKWRDIPSDVLYFLGNRFTGNRFTCTNKKLF